MITISSKDLIQNWQRNKNFTDKQKLREFRTTNSEPPAQEQILKRLT